MESFTQSAVRDSEKADSKNSGASAIGDTFKSTAAARNQAIGSALWQSGGLGPIDPADSRGAQSGQDGQPKCDGSIFSYWFDGKPIYERSAYDGKPQGKKNLLTLQPSN